MQISHKKTISEPKSHLAGSGLPFAPKLSAPQEELFRKVIGPTANNAKELIIFVEDENVQFMKILCAQAQIAAKSFGLDTLSFQAIQSGKRGLEEVANEILDVICSAPENCKIGLLFDHDHNGGFKGPDLAKELIGRLQRLDPDRQLVIAGLSGREGQSDVDDTWKNIGHVYPKACADPMARTRDILKNLLALAS